VSAITLPGDIPGLLRRGSPVVRTTDEGTRFGVVVDADPAFARSVVVTWEATPRHDAESDFLPRASMSLDLTDEAGADRAARWLVERTGPHVRVRVTAPRWECIGERRYSLDRRVFFHPLFGDDPTDPDPQGPVTLSGPTHHVPALASIDPSDPRADLLALRAVCLHVANIQEQP
jgi:hypothetical protein